MGHYIERQPLGGSTQYFTAGSTAATLNIDTTVAACGRDSTNTDVGDSLLRMGCNGHVLQALIAREAGDVIIRTLTVDTKAYGNYLGASGIYNTLAFTMKDVPAEVLFDGTIIVRVRMNEARSSLTKFTYRHRTSTTEYEPPGLVIYRTDEVSASIRDGMGGAIVVTIKP